MVNSILLKRIQAKLVKKTIKKYRNRKNAYVRKKKGNRRRDRSYGLKIMNEMKDSEFKRMFRMSRRAFQNLLDKVSPELSVDENQAIRGSGSPILPQTALAATIRWLAGGSYLDICALFGLDFHNFLTEITFCGRP